MSHPFFVRRLLKRERKVIAKLRKNPPNVEVYRRAQAVHFSSQQLQVPQIARIVNHDRSVVSRWLHRFEDEGLSGLWPNKSTGRPPKADGEFQAALIEAVEQNPRDLGYKFTRWTAALLAEHLRCKIHVEVVGVTVSKTLRRLGYRYGQPKLDLKHRQDPKEVARAKRQKRSDLKKRKPATAPWHLSTVTKRNYISTPASAATGLRVASV